MKTKYFILIGFLSWAFAAYGQTPVQNKGSIPPHLLRTTQSDGSAANLGQMLGIVDFGDGDSLVSFVPVYVLNDSTLKIGTDTVITSGNLSNYTSSADSSIFATLYRLDTAKANIRTEIAAIDPDPTMGGDLSGVASNAQIVAGAVGNTELATDAVTAEKIIAAGVGTSEIATNSVLNTRLADMAANTIKGRNDVGTGDPKDLTPAEAATVVLPGLLTIDGAGSGLDADLLDGQHGSYYNNLDNATGTIATAQIEDDAVTLAKQASGTANRIQGWDASGNPVAYSAGSNVTISGNQISASGGISGLTTNYLPKATGPTSLGNSQLFDDGSNVGIGTATPTKKLDIVSTSVDGGLQILSKGSGNRPSINLGIEVNASTGYAAKLFTHRMSNTVNQINAGEIGVFGQMYTSPSTPTLHYMYFGASNTTEWNDNTLRIYPNNNISISGSTRFGVHGTPQEIIDVTGNIRTSGQIQWAGSTTYMGLAGGALNLVTPAGSEFAVNVEGGSTDLFVDNNAVGIGTVNPANRLDVEGAAVIGASYSGSVVGPTNGLLVEGNVGIGSNDAEATLHVEGVGGYGLFRSTNGTLSTRIIFENEGDDNDSWQMRRSSTGEFVLGHSTAQPYSAETKVIECTASEVRILQDMVLDVAGDVRILVGSGVPSASVGNGSTYHRTDGTGPNFYVRENGAWVAK